MKERAVTKVLNEVALAHERCRTNPLCAFATHLGETNVVSARFVLEGHHDVATNADTDEFISTSHCGPVVRTA